MFRYSRETGVLVYVYRLPNVFGKCRRPDYNSAFVTFCNNIANDLPVRWVKMKTYENKCNMLIMNVICIYRIHIVKVCCRTCDFFKKKQDIRKLFSIFADINYGQ